MERDHLGMRENSILETGSQENNIYDSVSIKVGNSDENKPYFEERKSDFVPKLYEQLRAFDAHQKIIQQHIERLNSCDELLKRIKKQMQTANEKSEKMQIEMDNLKKELQEISKGK